MAVVKRHFGSNPHVEVSKDGYANCEYCTKTDTRMEGPWEYGPLPAKRNKGGETAVRNKQLIEMGTARAIEEGHICLKDAVKLHAAINLYKSLTSELKDLDQLDNWWYYGKTGAGKSREARQHYGDSLYNKPFNTWWCAYSGEETVLIDDLDQKHDWMGKDLKTWADHYKFTANMKNTSAVIRPKRVVVTSNFHPRDIWSDPRVLDPIMRRFKIKEFNF